MADQTIPTIKNLRGNIGIGTASPSYKLEVDGGDFLVNTTNGGYVQVDESDNSLKLSDNIKLKVGTGNDLKIYHDGSHSYVADTGTGGLKILGSQIEINNAANSENIATFTENGAASLFYDNVKKFETTSAGATITGSLTVSSDLIINGTTTTIDTTNLLVEDKNIVIGNVDTPSDTTADGGGITLKGASDYTINWLNSNDSWNFNQGIVVGEDGTGYDVTFHSATAGRAMSWDSTDRKLNFGDLTSITLGAGDDLTFYHNAHSYIQSKTNTLFILNTQADGQTRFQADDGTGSAVTDYLTINGSQELCRFDKPVHVGVDDTGHDVKFFGATSGRYGMWDQAGNRFKVSDSAEYVAGTGNDLKIYHNGTNSYLKNTTGDLYIKTEVNDGDIRFESDDGSGNEAEYFRLDGGDVRTIFSKDVRFLDNVEVGVGTNKALAFEYNGANSYISNLYGDLYIDQHNDNADIRFNCDNGSGGITEYFRIDGGANQNVFPVSVLLNDGVYLHIGTGSDLQLYHDATNSNINNNTGDLHILNTADDKDILLRADDGSGGNATYIQLDGSVTRNKLLQHTSLPDGKTLILGAGDDLYLYHSGTHSYIENNTGNLYIRNNADDNDIIFESDDGSGGTTPYFRLDGDSGYTKAHKEIRMDDSIPLRIGTGGDARFMHDGNNTYLDNYTGDFYIRQATDDKDLIFQCDDGSGGNETYFFLDGSTGTTPYTIFPDSSRLTFGNSTDLQIFHDGNNSYISHVGSGSLTIRNKTEDTDIYFKCDDGSGGEETYFFLDGSKSTGDPYTIFPNNSFLGFGDSGNLLIRHTGLGASIQNNGGDISITQNTNDGDIRFYCDDGSGGTAEYFRVDGGATLTYFSKSIRFADGIQSGFGADNDLVIYHNTSGDSVIDNFTGDLYISNKADDKDIVFRSDDGSGGYETYFYLDGSASSGSPFTVFPDNSKLTFGNGNDLILEHNGADSYISNYTGDLYFRNDATDKDIIFQSDDGSGGLTTYFYLDGSYGGTVFNRTATWTDNDRVELGTGSDLQLSHNGTDSFITNNNGDLHIVNYADDKDIILQSDDGSGGATAYLTLDGSSGYMWASKAIRFADGVNAQWGASADLVLRHNGTTSYIENYTGNLDIKQHADDSDIIFYSDDGSGGSAEYFRLDGGGVYMWASKNLVFADSVSAQFGNVGDLLIHHNGTNSYIQNDTGDFRIEQRADDGDMEFYCDNGSGGIAKYFHLDGGEQLIRVSCSNGMHFNDNVRIKVGSGTGGDLRIYHDGSSSIIANETGHLDIINNANDADIRFKCDDGGNNLATYFYLDGSLADGTYLNTRFPDNSRILFGTGGDFVLNHDGTNSYIDNETGDLYIRAKGDDKDIIFQSDDGSGGTETYFYLDGSVSSGNPFTIFPTAARCAWGNSAELQITHTGTDSYIANYTGHLYVTNDANDKDIIFQCDDGSGGLHEYMRLDGGMYHVIFSKSTQHADGAYGKFGNGGDLQLSHNGTNSFIKNTNGDLYIENSADDKDIIFKSDDGSGGTETYFLLDGSASSGNPIIRYPDNSIITLGTDNDCYLYHNGTDTRFQNNTGDLLIQNAANDKDILFSCDDGSGGNATYFFLDGSASSGEPFTVFPDNSQIAFGDSRDLRIDHNGTDSLVQNYVGNLVIRNYADDKDIEFHCDNGSGGTETYFFLDGSVSSGNPITKFPDNSILALGTSGDFYHYHDGTNSYHANFTGDFYIDNNANDKDVILRSDDGSGGVTAYITLDGSATDIKFSKNVDASSQNIVAYYLEGTYKSFLIDHPTQEGKKLRHGCLEGPEHGVYFRGNSSDSIIECPEYWMGLVEEDSVTVQLTAIGPNQNIYVDHIDEDGNIHVGSNTDEPLNYYYTVNGERKGDKVVVVEDA